MPAQPWPPGSSWLMAQPPQTSKTACSLVTASEGWGPYRRSSFLQGPGCCPSRPEHLLPHQPEWGDFVGLVPPQPIAGTHTHWGELCPGAARHDSGPSGFHRSPVQAERRDWVLEDTAPPPPGVGFTDRAKVDFRNEQPTGQSARHPPVTCFSAKEPWGPRTTLGLPWCPCPQL